MKRIQSTLLVLAFLFLTGNIFGQAALGLTSRGINLSPNPVDYPADSVLTIDFAVQNKGNASFTGPLFIFGRFNADPNSYVLELFNAIDLMPGDSIEFEIDDPILLTRYKGGDNIIVIWPGTDQIFVNTLDSGKAHIFISGLPLLTNLSDPKPSPLRINIFPNPLENYLNLEFLGSRKILEYVRIEDVNGREVYFDTNPGSRINTSDFQKGIYLLTARFSDGYSQNLKILKLN